MTALNLWVQEHSAHLITDGAQYHPDGRIFSISSKVLVFPEARVAISTRGAATVERVRERYAHVGAVSQAELYAHFAAICANIKAENDLWHPERDVINGLGLTAIAWDDAADRPIAWHVGTDPLTLLEGMEPNTVYKGGIGWMSPQIDDWSGIEWDDLCPDRDGPRILQAQRDRLEQTPSGSAFHMVGGFGEATTVTRDGVKTRRICEWPEDSIGELITPTKKSGQDD